jgi:hypothetical protein
MNQKIIIGTEVHFYNDPYGYFSDKVVRIEGTKAVFAGWPKYSDGQLHYVEYMVSIASIKSSAYNDTIALMQYVPHGAGLRGFDGRQTVNCSLNKKEVLGIYLQQIDYQKKKVIDACDAARKAFEHTLDKVGELENKENKIKEEIAKL